MQRPLIRFKPQSHSFIASLHFRSPTTDWNTPPPSSTLLLRRTALCLSVCRTSSFLLCNTSSLTTIIGTLIVASTHGWKFPSKKHRTSLAEFRPFLERSSTKKAKRCLAALIHSSSNYRSTYATSTN